MLEKIKKGMALARYGLGFRTQTLFAVLFMLVGFVLEFLDEAGNILGGFYIVFAGMFIVQLVISLNLSTLVQTSPYKKKLETIIPILASTPLLLVNYTVLLLIRLYYLYGPSAASLSVERQLEIKSGLIAISLLLCVMAIYMSACYKFFWATFVFVMAIVFLVSFMSSADCFVQLAMRLPTGVIAGVGYLLILAGQAGGYLLSCLFYKRELSRYAFSAALKRMRR